MIDANSQFFAILTNVGMAKQANADALGIPWKFTEMGVGDANNTDPIPSATQTHLINEWRRSPLNQLRVDPVNAAVIIAEQIIPADEGGHWIREIGLYDADGDLVAVANCAPSFKPVLSQGSGRTQVVRMNFIVSSTANITLKIDPAVVLATREYVDTRILEELYKLDSKQSVRVATTANIALAGLQSIDGIALAAGDRVLVKNQAVGKDNGLYIAAAGIWARALDADTSAEVTSALLVSVEQGTTLADTRWQLITDGVIVLGTTALTFQNVTQGFAPINSPALLGTPTAPTADPGTNTTQLATTAFVEAARVILAAVDALKAPLASPALTGNPTTPTQAAGDNDTSIASTAFVQAATNGRVTVPVDGTGSIALTAAQYGVSIINLTGVLTGARTVIFPNLSGVWLVNNNTTGAFTVTLQTAAGAGVLVTQGQDTCIQGDSVGIYLQQSDFISPALTGVPTAPTAAPGTNTTQLATTAFVEAARVILAAADALKAPLASPALTGTPTAPTAAPGTNTTQVATTAFIQAAVAALVSSSPAALDTLNELAAALGDDPNFATTITTALGLKAPLANPALSGIPTAPTAAAGTNTTQVATTAFVEAARVILAAADALKAPLASPVFTGTPTAPNPATGTRSAALATMQKFADEFGASISGNGYQKLPTGWIIQWGSGSAGGAGASATNTFPIAFPNAVRCIIAQHLGTDASVNIIADSTIGLGSPTQFGLRSSYSGTVSAQWIAIGN